MRDNLNPYSGHGDAGGERPRRGLEGEVPLSDREVPLEGTSTSDVINRWLDGELADPTALRGDTARHVDFWRRIGEETERRRRVVTPPHVKAQIMAALPAAPSTALPWWKRPVEVTAGAAIAVAAGLLAIGALVALAIR